MLLTDNRQLTTDSSMCNPGQQRRSRAVEGPSFRVTPKSKTCICLRFIRVHLWLLSPLTFAPTMRARVEGPASRATTNPGAATDSHQGITSEPTLSEVEGYRTCCEQNRASAPCADRCAKSAGPAGPKYHSPALQRWESLGYLAIVRVPEARHNLAQHAGRAAGGVLGEVKNTSRVP